jgi:hypothetical protein
MNSFRLLILAAFVFVFAHQSQSQERGWTYFFNANQLYTKCNSSSAVDIAWCEAYIAGVIDAYGGSKNHTQDAKALSACFEKKISLRQSRATVLKVLSEMRKDVRSALDHLPGSRTVIAAFSVDICE